jgi:hypothetical protein
MKKILLLSSILLLTFFSVNAQDNNSNAQGNNTQGEDTVTKERRVRFDLQIAQSFGLNDWNKIKFASDRLPSTFSSTDLRATFNLYIAKRVVGLFLDAGAGIMPAPRNGSADPVAQATSSTGIPFYTKEIIAESGSQSAGVHVKMTFGLFGKFSIAEKLSVLPRFGVGFMTVSAPAYEAILKEQNTNMQYIASYQWFEDEYSDDGISLGYLASRLCFAYHISPKNDILFGLEYTWHFRRADFSEIYTNYFNRNITKKIYHKGNQLSMLGISVGVSF